MTAEALQERRASLSAALEEALAKVNVIIGRRNECDYWLDLLAQPEETQEEA